MNGGDEDADLLWAIHCCEHLLTLLELTLELVEGKGAGGRKLARAWHNFIMQELPIDIIRKIECFSQALILFLVSSRCLYTMIPNDNETNVN